MNHSYMLREALTQMSKSIVSTARRVTGATIPPGKICVYLGNKESEDIFLEVLSKELKSDFSVQVECSSDSLISFFKIAFQGLANLSITLAQDHLLGASSICHVSKEMSYVFVETYIQSDTRIPYEGCIEQFVRKGTDPNIRKGMDPFVLTSSSRAERYSRAEVLSEFAPAEGTPLKAAQQSEASYSSSCDSSSSSTSDC